MTTSGAAAPAPRAHLREATADDLDALIALERRCFPPEDVYPAYEYRRLLGNRSSVNLLATVGEEVVGFAGGYRHPGMGLGHVYTVNVDPDHRCEGHATRLLRGLEERLRERGCDEVILEVRVDNAPAIRLYERLGYARIGRLPRYYPGPGEGDAWQYTKRLEERVMEAGK